MVTYTLFHLLSVDFEIPAEGILSRTVFTDEQVKVVWFGFSAGQSLSEHTASQPAILHCLSGEAELQLGTDTHTIQAGGWVHLPAGLPHGVLAKTPFSMLLLLLKRDSHA